MIFAIIRLAKEVAYIKFDENLRAFRKQKEFSQEYLAEKMNVSRQTISKWENGTAMPDLKKLTDLASLFDVSMDELLGTSAPDYKTSVSDNAELENLKQAFDEYKAKNKKTTIIFGAVSTVLVVALIFITVNLSNSIANLQSRVNSLPSGQVIYQNDGDDGTECRMKCAYLYNDTDGFDSTAESVEVTPEVTIRFPNGMKLTS